MSPKSGALAMTSHGLLWSGASRSPPDRAVLASSASTEGRRRSCRTAALPNVRLVSPQGLTISEVFVASEREAEQLRDYWQTLDEVSATTGLALHAICDALVVDDLGVAGSVEVPDIPSIFPLA
jgi:hypothetical protein